MRRYETIMIVDPDLSEDDRTSLLSRVKEIIPQQQGVLLKEDLWGTKKLAYEIKKKPRGFYARFDYCGMGPAVDELERFFRIDDGVLKYLTVQLAEEADPEKILSEMAAEEASATAAESASAPSEASEPATQTAGEAPAPEAPAPDATPASTEPDKTETATESSEKE
ncbi:MAG: 30S ribosomal protein S6 [Desulfobacteraceae bacterium]|jgi:small subunit ribosomal protein S6